MAEREYRCRDFSIFWGYSTKNLSDINQFKGNREYPKIKQSGRKSLPVNSETEELILSSYYTHKLSPVLLEKKIKEIHVIHIRHNRIYRVLLLHGLVEINMKKRKKGNGFDMSGNIPCRCGRLIGKNSH